MRIVIMLSSVSMGGAEQNIVTALPYFRDAGVEIMVCTLNKRRDSPLAGVLDQHGIERFDLGARRMIDLAALRRFFAMLRDKKIDVLHTQDQDSHVYGALARWRLGIPTVMTRHVMEEPAPSFKKRIRAQLVFWSARFGMKKIIAVSDVVRKHFAEQAHVPLSKVVTVYNGIDAGKFDTRAMRNSKRAELGWDPDAPTVVMVGVLRPGKGHDVLLKALPAIVDAVPQVRIKLVGDGKLRDSLEAEFAPFAKIVEFMGSRTDVAEILGASDILVLPSWSEALPTVLMEAGAASLPVVATDVGGTREIVEDGKQGYVVPPGDPAAFAQRVIELLNSPNLGMTMGAAGKQQILGKFILQEQARQTIEIYKSILRK